MKEQPGRRSWRKWLILAVLTAAATAVGREEPFTPPFRYAGGTERISADCRGNLELAATGFTFTCPGGSISVPFSSISHMEYRRDLSKKVRKLKIKWRLRPTYVSPIFGGKKNRFLTLVFNQDGATRVIVLRVEPGDMRPYLAEIDLKTGKRVEVQGYERY